MRLLALITLLLASFTNALIAGARGDPTALLRSPPKAASSSCNASGTRRGRKVVMQEEEEEEKEERSFKLEKTARLGLDRPKINLYEQQKGFESRMKVSRTIAELRAKGMDQKAVKPQKKKK